MLAIIIGLGIILFAVVMIFLETNNIKINNLIKIKGNDEDSF